jgi:hypothetical protein
VGGQYRALATLLRERDPVPITQEADWVPGLVWTGAENITPPGFDPRIVEPTARSHQIRYPGPLGHYRTTHSSDLYVQLF